jgi:hypothetical protein
MPATYINHYAANGGVVVPQFGGAAAETDRLAIETLQKVLLLDTLVILHIQLVIQGTFSQRRQLSHAEHLLSSLIGFSSYVIARWISAVQWQYSLLFGAAAGACYGEAYVPVG